MNPCEWRLMARVVSFILIGGTFSAASAGTSRPDILPNDNRRSAGSLNRGTLTVALRAAAGRWRPEGAQGPALEIEAFGEVGKALTVPAPLIRVTEGTAIVAAIRNDLDAPLVIHGLCARDGTPCTPVEVAPQETHTLRFDSGRAGTYHYWASTIGAPVPFRELAGALIVDPPDAAPATDRILVVTEWSSLTAPQLGQIFTADVPTEEFVRLKPRLTFVINGLSWPATERLAYAVGEPVRWRVINLSSQPHPLHLHGFYFEVHSLGNGVRDSLFEPSTVRRVVTQLMPPGGTMTMTWIPERAGNWLFHCHVLHHVSRDRRLAEGGAEAHHGSGAHTHSTHDDDASAGMAGMVIGVTVRNGTPPAADHVQTAAPRKLVLAMQRAPTANGERQSTGFVLSEGTPSPAAAVTPGPAIILRRDEPVEITLVNHLTEPTAIHWHGIELDSFYDGVHGYSGQGRRVTPMIDPGSTFVVRFTPPRAGTFIYHTHVHDYRQLSSGLYGPLIVMDRDETFDPAGDHVIVIGRSGLASDEPSLLTEPDSVVINGERAPRLVWKAGARHRVRLINITPDDIFKVTLQSGAGSVKWTPLTKDGAPVPAPHAMPLAADQSIAVGETYDFEYEAPAGRHTLWLNVQTPGGKWQAQGRVVVR
jgi:FtsP/CotA-like multicopper oxidase with cupredoxin domain